MGITYENLRDQIPYYLTQGQKEGFLKALEDFPINTNYYLFPGEYNDTFLQGDGWTKLEARIFETGNKESILGIILSNSCDMSPENRRDIPAQITFAPLIPLSKYIQLLKANGVDQGRINDKMATIKEQKVSSVFFLPTGSGLKEDHIALLDQLYTMPLRVFMSEDTKSKVFTLSSIGFYLLLFKLSYHFCRFNERVARS